MIYQGQVNVKYNFEGREFVKTIHNEGLSTLFKFFMNSIVGYYDDNARPRYIDLGYKESVDDTSYKSILNNILPITSTALSQLNSSGTNNWTALLTARLQSFNISEVSKNNSNEKPKYIFLLDSNSNILAQISISEDQAIIDSLLNIPNDQQILLEWQMCIKNKGD